MENVACAIRMAVNAVNRVRDLVYLDTNAWSMLARGERPVEPLAQWVEDNSCFLLLARMQVAELSARPDIIQGLARVVENVGVVMLDRDQHEFSGKPWYQVRREMQQYVKLTTPELRTAFVEEFSKLNTARLKALEDGEKFEGWLREALQLIPSDEPRDWSTFPRRLRARIRALCEMNGQAVVEAAVEDPNCYAGIRLSYAVLFMRYFINQQRWKSGDYFDYLHAADMAYAKLVVTERNLAECVRQALRQPGVTGPEIVVDTSWLRAPA